MNIYFLFDRSFHFLISAGAITMILLVEPALTWGVPRPTGTDDLIRVDNGRAVEGADHGSLVPSFEDEKTIGLGEPLRPDEDDGTKSLIPAVGTGSKDATGTSNVHASDTASSQTSSDTIYSIEFGSNHNSVELDVQNVASTGASGVSVVIQSPPAWLHVSATKIGLQSLKPGGTESATFQFSVDKDAPAKKTEALTFLVVNNAGGQWTKTIKVRVAVPTQFRLFQNFPNPFNPTTAIAYEIAEDARVTLSVYNILGQEVAKIFDSQRSAGYYEISWNGSSLASGTYFYQMQILERSGNQQVFRNKMMLIK
jgi:hypothetical protein